MSNNFWIKNPAILLNKQEYQYITLKNLSSVRFLNLITLILLIILIIFLIFCPIYAFIPIILIALIIFIYYTKVNTIQKVITDEYKNQAATQYAMPKLTVPKIEKPTKVKEDNPLGNITVDDLNKVNLIDKREHYKDIGENLDRQFYRQPVIDIPNDQGKFARWLYSTPQTCKENTAQCKIYEDTRYG